MMREHTCYGHAVGRDQAYRVAEIRGRRAARADDIYFLFREGARPHRRRPRGHADDHDPAGRRHQLDGLRQDAGLAAGLDDEGRSFAPGPVVYVIVQLRLIGVHLFGAQALGQVAAAGLRVDGEYACALVFCGDQRGQADRAGAEDDDLLAGLELATGQGVHGDRGGLDEARAVRVQVADPEDQPGRDLEPFGQAAVEVHADQPEPDADVGALAAAGIAAAARQHRPDRDPLALGDVLAVAGVLDDRGYLVALDPRVEVADAGKRAHVTGKQVEVGAADADRFGPDDDVPGPGAARS